MRRWLPLVLVIAVVAAATACGGTPGADRPTTSTAQNTSVSTDISGAKATTLSVWTSESGQRLAVLQQLGKQFEQAHPNVKLKWVVRDFGAYPAQIKLALTSKNGPDVAIGNLGWSLDGPLIKAGLFRPVDDYAAAYGWTKRYPPIGLRQLKFTSDGKTYGEGPIWGAPYAADVIGWFYNVRLLKQLGVGVPKTLADLEATMAKAKKAGVQPILLGNKDNWAAWHVLFNIADQIATPKEISGIVYGDKGATYLNPDVKASVTRLVGWMKKGYINSDTNGLSYADAGARFTKGGALFYPAGSWNAAGFGDSMKNNVGFFLSPPVKTGQTPRATGSFGYAFHISARSKQPAVGAAFLDWMSNANAARAFFARGDISPMTVEKPKLKAGKIYADIFRAWQTVLKNDTLLPYLDFATPTAGEVEYPTLQSILAGKMSTSDGLKAIEDARQKFLASNR